MDGREGTRPQEAPMADRSWTVLPVRFRTWIFGLLSLIEDLQNRIKDLEARVGQDSTNSSRPPSTDGPGSQKRDGKKRPGGRRKRRPGGQPGHKGHQRPLVPADEVDKREEHRPDSCGNCGRHLPESLSPVSDPRRHQVVEIPEITRTVFEWVLHGLACPDCDHTTYASHPEGVPLSSFGPNLRALLVLLSGRYRTSRREVSELVGDVLEISISVGAIDNACRRVSEALVEAVDEVAARVKEAPVVHVDETGWREKGQRVWLWVVVTSFAVLFRIATRCKREATELLGADFQGDVVSDRYAVYLQFDPERRQVCWAHLARDFQSQVDRGGVARRFGEQAIEIKDKLFKIWRRYKVGRIRRDTMEQQMLDVEVELGELLEQGKTSKDQRTAGLCKALAKVGPALFLFARKEGVEPTNNAAEQAVRPAVIWRKTCFGTQSARGSRFVERMMTVTMTCRAQRRSPFQYLRRVTQATDRGDPTPSLFDERAVDSPQESASTAA